MMDFEGRVLGLLERYSHKLTKVPGNYTITVQVDNEVSSERVSRLLVVRPGYTAVLDPVTEDLYPRATPIGRVEYFQGNIIQALVSSGFQKGAYRDGVKRGETSQEPSNKLLRGFVPVTVEISRS